MLSGCPRIAPSVRSLVSRLPAPCSLNFKKVNQSINIFSAMPQCHGAARRSAAAKVSLPQSDRQIKTFEHRHTHTSHRCMYACARTHIHTDTHCMCACARTHVCAHMCVCTHIHVCMPHSGGFHDAVTSRPVFSKRPPYKHTPFGGLAGSLPGTLCWVQRSGGR